MDDKNLERSFIELILETWRMSKVLNDILPKLNEEDYSRYKGRYSWFCKKLYEITNAAGFKIVEISPGTNYDIGMAVNPVNISDFQTDDLLQVDQMLEPIIMRENSVIKTGTVILRRIAQ